MLVTGLIVLMNGILLYWSTSRNYWVLNFKILTAMFWNSLVACFLIIIVSFVFFFDVPYICHMILQRFQYLYSFLSNIRYFSPLTGIFNALTCRMDSLQDDVLQAFWYNYAFAFSHKSILH